MTLKALAVVDPPVTLDLVLANGGIQAARPVAFPSGPGGGQIASFVWNVSVPSSGNTYQTFAEVQAAIDALNGGPYLLSIEAHPGATPHVPAGSWNLGNGYWQPNPGTQLVQVVFDDGATITLRNLHLSSVFWLSTSTTPVWAVASGFQILRLESSDLSVSSSAPFWHATGGASAVLLSELSSIGASGVGSGVAQVDAGVAGSIIATQMSQVAAGALVATVGGGGALQYTSDCTVPLPLPAGWADLPKSTGIKTVYAPTTPGDWTTPAPVLVDPALDRLAARTHAGRATVTAGTDTVTVPLPSVDLNTAIVLTYGPGIGSTGAPWGTPVVSDVTAGTSFSITLINLTTGNGINAGADIGVFWNATEFTP